MIQNSVSPDLLTTGSRGSRVLGLFSLLGIAVLLVFALGLTEPDIRLHPTTGDEIGQFDAVRLLYLHVPLAVCTYVAFFFCALSSACYLIRRTSWFDTMAYATAEVGTVFCGLVLITGSIWGRPVWNTWWEWGDVRLMTTLVLFLMFLGYLGLRRATHDMAVSARRGAVVALVAVINLPIVNRSVEWWENRTLHQKSTLGDLKIQDLTLFTLILGFFVFFLVMAWLLLHRFRVGWLERQGAEHRLATAITERRAGVDRDSLDVAVGGMS